MVRVHGESASATVILPHPQQRDLLHVRWNTSMRQTSTISLTDATSMVPRHPKRPRVSATANHADPTANDRTDLTVNNRPVPTNTSQASHTADASASSTADTETAPATDGRVDPTAQGRRDPAAGDHANPAAEGCTDSTTDRHTGPGAHDTLSVCAEATHDNPSSISDTRNSGSATDTPDSSETVPASADALRAAAHADPTRARPEAGFVVRVHGESASATVILPHPEQRDLLHVRWNTSMRQTSTIDLTDIASVEPRQSKRPRISATAAETCPAAHNRTDLTADDSSTSAIAGQADPATASRAGPAADSNTAPTADGRADHAAHECRDSCPDHHHDALTADGHANLDADPRTDPDATADTSPPPRGDAPCAHVEDAPSTLGARSAPPARGSLLARTLGSVGDYAMAIAASARTNVLQLRWRAHSDEREQPGPCLDGTPAPPPEAPALPQAPHPQPATAAPARTVAQPEPSTGTRPKPPSRSLLPSGRPSQTSSLMSSPPPPHAAPYPARRSTSLRPTRRSQCAQLSSRPRAKIVRHKSASSTTTESRSRTSLTPDGAPPCQRGSPWRPNAASGSVMP